MTTSSPAGHARVQALLRQAVIRGRVPQTLLFAGPEGVGKHAVALALAQAINCSSSADGVACGRCSTCSRIAKGQFSDVVEVDNGDIASISIKSIRERVLNLVLVTPRMHGIHHSEVRHETNSNYSVVFSWWDRLHRTLGLNIPQSEIVIGVPGYAERRDNSVRNTLLLPFQRQREYWRRADGTPVERAGTARGSDRKTRLAE